MNYGKARAMNKYLGSVSYSNYNGEKATCIRYMDCKHIKIQFEDGVIMATSTQHFKEGKFVNPLIKQKEYVGKTRIAKNSNLEATCIKYIDSKHVIIKFDDGKITTTRPDSFLNGTFSHPDAYLPITVAQRKKRIGEERTMNCGMKCKIINYNIVTDITVKFEDGFVTNSSYKQFKKGEIVNPNIPSTRSRRLKQKYEGMTITHKATGKMMKLIEYRDGKDCDVQFDDGLIVQHVPINNFLKGHVNRNKNRQGIILRMNNGLYAKAIKVDGTSDGKPVTIQFEDGYTKKVKWRQFIHRIATRPGLPPYSPKENERTYLSFDVKSKPIDVFNERYFECKCKKCGYEGILTAREMMDHACCKIEPLFEEVETFKEEETEVSK